MAKLQKVEGAIRPSPNYSFECPGCGISHGVWLGDSPNANGAAWGYNGNIDSPTITPSILVKWGNGNGDQVCHSYVTDGKIQFLGDCSHELAGQTVEMQEV